MNDRIETEILKLKAGAPGVVFTGFVTNASVEPPAMLTGEVWCHVCADGFGTFADGHRIQTSDIVEIHGRGDSLWVTTQSGSDYGILSFTSRGWKYFADLYQAHHRLDPLPPDSPAFHILSPTGKALGLATKRAERLKHAPAPLNRKARKQELLGPAQDPEYMYRMEAFIQETIATLQRNGVKTFSPDE